MKRFDYKTTPVLYRTSTLRKQYSGPNNHYDKLTPSDVLGMICSHPRNEFTVEVGKLSDETRESVAILLSTKMIELKSIVRSGKVKGNIVKSVLTLRKERSLYGMDD